MTDFSYLPSLEEHHSVAQTPNGPVLDFPNFKGVCITVTSGLDSCSSVPQEKAFRKPHPEEK